jgi:hypothetical protein
MDCLPHIHIAAYHAEAGYNNNTPGLGVLCDAGGDWRLAAGTYFNSVRKQSYYAGAAWQPVKIGAVKLGAYGGLATGYKPHAVPFAAGVVSVPLGRAEFHLIAIPKVTGITPATAALSVTWRF